jgi:hypothetical protein
VLGVQGLDGSLHRAANDNKVSVQSINQLYNQTMFHLHLGKKNTTAVALALLL